MIDIEKIFSNFRITNEAIEIQEYINKTWSKLFYAELEKPLKDIFPEPENRGLKHIWKYGSADIVVRRKLNNEICLILEPGGAHHFNDEKQVKNDKRKWKLCEINNVECVHLVNSLKKNLSNRKWRNFLGKFLFKNVKN